MEKKIHSFTPIENSIPNTWNIIYYSDKCINKFVTRLDDDIVEMYNSINDEHLKTVVFRTIVLFLEGGIFWIENSQYAVNQLILESINSNIICTHHIIIGAIAGSSIVKEYLNELVYRRYLNYHTMQYITNKILINFSICKTPIKSQDQSFIYELDQPLTYYKSEEEPYGDPLFSDVKKISIDPEIQKEDRLVKGVFVEPVEEWYNSYLSMIPIYIDNKRIRIDFYGKTKEEYGITINIKHGSQIIKRTLRELLENPIIELDNTPEIFPLNYKQKIPKKIYYFTTPPDPENCIRISIASFINANPEYIIERFDEFDARKFIEKNFDKKVLIAYDMINPYAYKSDLWRICKIYKDGGLYIDDKLFCISSLRNTIQSDDDLVLCIDIGDKNIFNAIIGAIPEHPLFMIILNKIVENILNKRILEIFDITGPELIGKCLLEYTNNTEKWKPGLYIMNGFQFNLLHHPESTKYGNYLHPYNLSIYNNCGQKIITKFHGQYISKRKQNISYEDYYSNNCLYNNADMINIQFNYDYCFSYTHLKMDLFDWRVFEINKDILIIIVQRIDILIGWNYNLILSLKEKKFEIGSSITNFKICKFSKCGKKISDIAHYMNISDVKEMVKKMRLMNLS